MDNKLLKEAIDLLKMVTPINEFALESGMYDDIAKRPEYDEREIGAYRQLTHSEQFKVIQFIRKVENILGADGAN